MKKCFNPCFNGYSTLTNIKKQKGRVYNLRFNPCFNGYSTLTLVICPNLQ